MELGCEPKKKKKAQESEDEMWARMDKRIERARAKQEFARPVMGTIFLVIIIIIYFAAYHLMVFYNYTLLSF